MDIPSLIYDELIYKKYKTYIKTLNKLLKYIPIKYFNKLKSIHVNLSSLLSHNEKRKKIGGKRNKVKLSDCLGYYSFPKIVLFIDNIISNSSKYLMIIPLFKYLILSKTLYHELGHHVHKCIKPEYKEKEKNAEEYRIYFQILMFKKRYWYLFYLFIFIKKIFNIFHKKK